MKSKLPKDLSMSELEDIMFLVIKKNYPDMTDEGVEMIIKHYNAGFEHVSEDNEYWEN